MLCLPWVHSVEHRSNSTPHDRARTHIRTFFSSDLLPNRVSRVMPLTMNDTYRIVERAMMLDDLTRGKPELWLISIQIVIHHERFDNVIDKIYLTQHLNQFPDLGRAGASNMISCRQWRSQDRILENDGTGLCQVPACLPMETTFHWSNP